MPRAVGPGVPGASAVAADPRGQESHTNDVCLDGGIPNEGRYRGILTCGRSGPRLAGIDGRLGSQHARPPLLFLRTP
jgi:hypothetical protein